ncbi:MAG: aspartate kinase [Bacteroidia bacterium]|nr:MAG: aspartate kinase [Bacteroidia bacterium]
MIVYKFGGASMKDASGIRNLYDIVSREDKLVIVVSALGKTTNALEEVLDMWYNNDARFTEKLTAVSEYHLAVTAALFETDADVRQHLALSFSSLSALLGKMKPGDYDHDYDMIVSMGEIWSTMIVEGYLHSRGLKSRWIDIRRLLVTDGRHRDAGINWEISSARMVSAFSFSDVSMYVTQGFIGATADGTVTTLGREGSDYTAALIANMLDAEKVVVWKDVPGIMSADPKWLDSAVTLSRISYNEAVEMTFSGAKVIHPNTIKPLHNKKIPMQVRSFIDHDAPGTIISEEVTQGPACPVFVRKEEQILISVLPKDLSFVMGENLANVFHLFSENGVKVNLVQAGAVSINVCADNEEPKIERVLEELRKDYTILYNEGAVMLTVRHYDDMSLKQITDGMEVLISQTTRNSIRMVVRRQ